MNSNTPDRSSRGIMKQSRNLAAVLCLGMLAGVLIWAKLRLVTDIPRSAYADPREVQVPEQEPVGSSLQDNQLADPALIDKPETDPDSISDPDAELPDKP